MALFRICRIEGLYMSMLVVKDLRYMGVKISRKARGPRPFCASKAAICRSTQATAAVSVHILIPCPLILTPSPLPLILGGRDYSLPKPRRAGGREVRSCKAYHEDAHFSTSLMSC